MKTSELTGAALDWAVAKCNGYDSLWDVTGFKPSSCWADGGPIIEREGLCLIKTGTAWLCTTNGNALHSHAKEDPTPLIAAMRCYVASKLGDDVDVPDTLV